MVGAGTLGSPWYIRYTQHSAMQNCRYYWVHLNDANKVGKMRFLRGIFGGEEQERVKGGLCVSIYGLAGWINLIIAYLGILSY